MSPSGVFFWHSQSGPTNIFPLAEALDMFDGPDFFVSGPWTRIHRKGGEIMNALRMGKKDIRREFVRYALPSVAGMLVSCLYTVVDGIFVGRGVGDLALGGVNIVFPYIMLVIAVTMLVAIGGANLASFQRGRGNVGAANSIFSQAAVLLALAGGALFAVAFFFSRETCVLLGADADLLPHAETYLRTMAPFVAVQTIGLGVGIFVRNDNAPNFVMLGTVSGAVVNIVLDYVFIMVWDWGIEGAAIATGIGLMLEFCVYVGHIVFKRGELRLLKPVFSAAETGKLLYNGIASFLMEFCQSAIAISFNIVIIRHIGPLGVAAYSVVNYLCSSFNMILIGITQGAQPILSFNHGKGDVEAVKGIHRLGAGVCLASSCVLAVVCLRYGSALASLFSGDGGGEMVALATRMLFYFCLAYAPIGLTLMNILFFQTTEREGRSVFLSVLRCVGFVQVFLLVLPGVWGERGIYWSFLFGETVNWAISLALYLAVAEPERAYPREASPVYVPVTSASGRLAARESARF